MTSMLSMAAHDHVSFGQAIILPPVISESAFYPATIIFFLALTGFVI
ncbi:MAG: hypothetical protein JXQ27_08060 [Acidobacteria bacterium]|nr:hypothetical protein [Acidobacteriota bacterium]